MTQQSMSGETSSRKTQTSSAAFVFDVCLYYVQRLVVNCVGVVFGAREMWFLVHFYYALSSSFGVRAN